MATYGIYWPDKNDVGKYNNKAKALAILKSEARIPTIIPTAEHIIDESRIASNI
ncbi:hypothetical protein SHM_19720 [Spiroplasma ixodetis]|uniref:Uncharacterized protein n=1 Tax=Spiroplasma ixodetis TaxID=2141 RepID=A0ABM8BWT6_9MOLU|nr:hypothetical protein SHM_19720 [Spiroplasma ixodetis]